MVVFHRVHLGLGSTCKGQPQTAYTEITELNVLVRELKGWIQIFFQGEEGVVPIFF